MGHGGWGVPNVPPHLEPNKKAEDSEEEVPKSSKNFLSFIFCDPPFLGELYKYRVGVGLLTAVSNRRAGLWGAGPARGLPGRVAETHLTAWFARNGAHGCAGPAAQGGGGAVTSGVAWQVRMTRPHDRSEGLVGGAGGR